MDLDLTGKSALVLAGSKGLGRAVATQLVSEGADVIITSSSQANLEDAVRSIQTEVNCDADRIGYRVCDLSKSESIEMGIEDAIDELGGLDILITNHGGPLTKTFSETTLDDFDNTYNEVLRSTIQVCQLALPYLQDSGGSITNLVAASTLEPNVSGSIANVIRPGIYGLSKTLANEYGSEGVRVNCVSPRGIFTDRIEYKIDVLADKEDITIKEAKERREAEVPLTRLGSPEEFAQAVTFIASPAAGFVTGSILHVDGGWSQGAF
ncbi:short-chain dehydrogenase/reductase SDR [Natronococcus amylolyticus DSM 10524]|uniref:Short-chain dehydrogenase/reductase SDR n=1 Tax=Natronococcus amylolyticus DSM 10524 TaxID=1227497 RepID=L9X2V9_9EURY|nr:SDR family oxidoreductase [Natronococcus amylolyticus]ELY56035.1 short-chain dehydrogenase/reductase SDR [Natronococcus amylolyticus DSM 10524]